MSKKSTTQFIEDEHTTEAMRVAHSQGWSLPDEPITALKAQLDAIADPHSIEFFIDQLGYPVIGAPDEIVKEARRLFRNEQVNVWRKRKRLEAAIDNRRAVTARKAKPVAKKKAAATKPKQLAKVA